nr:hypothetical protein [Halomonas socia]
MEAVIQVEDHARGVALEAGSRRVITGQGHTMERIRHIHSITKRLIIMTTIAVAVLGAIFALTFFFNQRFW